MTQHDGKIVMSKEAYDIIEWFTMNWNQEIGAVGVGKIENEVMYIEKLCFPKQVVTGVHVSFKPEMWTDIVNETTDDEFDRIIFYWHLHPGSASCSQGDEDETFDVFMAPEAERKMFGFLQTAKKGSNIDYEARIELREPIRVTIMNVSWERDNEDADRIAELCRNIIDTKIIKPAPVKPISRTTGYVNSYEEYDTPNTNYDSISNISEFLVWKKDGNVLLEYSDTLDDMVVAVNSTTDAQNITQDTTLIKKKAGVITLRLQPKKGKIDELFNYWNELKTGLDTPVEPKRTMCNPYDSIHKDSYDWKYN